MSEKTNETTEHEAEPSAEVRPKATTPPDMPSETAKPSKRSPKVAENTATPPAKSSATDRPSVSEDLQEAKETAKRIKDLEALIADLQGKQDGIESEMATNRTAMRNTILDGLGVIDKFKRFAPDADPFTDEGRAALEAWASENPELLSARPAPVVDVDTDKVKSNMRSPHLVDFKTFARSMKRGG